MTPDIVARATGARIDRATQCAPGLTAAMELYDINTPARQAMFLANIGHETGGLKWLSEIWGPTPAQIRYEGRADLGNTQPGDGRRFKGHGMLQTTGRFNHAAVRDRLRKRFPEMEVPDFEAEPEKLAEPQWAALAAADYIAMKDCQRFADAGDFDGYCDTINRGKKTAAEGDSNGWDDRLALYLAAQEALS
ncbi:glycoside hydrolase family 19 protein [Polaromonas sp.]|uniref:glycoside hydrolase family 19 protein n=1 Tax=Polaromonas sp. TaxID=1869339 RepID=UPI0032634198